MNFLHRSYLPGIWVSWTRQHSLSLFERGLITTTKAALSKTQAKKYFQMMSRCAQESSQLFVVLQLLFPVFFKVFYHTPSCCLNKRDNDLHRRYNKNFKAEWHKLHQTKLKNLLPHILETAYKSNSSQEIRFPKSLHPLHTSTLLSRIYQIFNYKNSKLSYVLNTQGLHQ